jgi:fermentation-respiration switch protein FrsA (DUF1100 family)
LVYLLSIVLIVFLALGGLLWSQQRVLLYHPDPARFSPATVGLKSVEEVVLEAPDGVEIISWYGKARPAQPTILYFHGNGSNLVGRAGRVGEYMAKGRGMMMMSYRGYSGSGGKPTEAHNFADARLAYDWLRAQGVAADDIILYGESLGSGVALKLATEVPVGGIILDAPFTSIVDVGKRIYPYLPVRTFLFDRYDNRSRIGNIRAPLLIVHGDRDELIPIEMGRELYRKAPEPKEFAAIAGGGHNDHYLFGSYEIIHVWMDVHFPARGGRDMAEGASAAGGAQ